ncbi:MAG: hypothetical protein ABJC19_06095 [Gemmatimonadota bacterium]
MSLLGIVLLVALCIPIFSMLVDGPIGRAFAKRLEREPTPATRRDEEIGDLKRRLDQLEGDIDMLHQSVTQLREENEFLQRLLEAGPRRPPAQG